MKVLLVEDSPTDALLLREALAEAAGDFDVVHVDRLHEALQRLQNESFDIVISDLGLPDSAGLTAVASLRDQVPDVPIVVLTGVQDEKLGLTALREGAQDWLVKEHTAGPMLARSLRYAIERQEAKKLRARHEQLGEFSRNLWQTARLATMGELAASVAHELNNPLAIVTLRVESLLSQVPATDPKHRALEIIEHETERMGALVAQLLEYSRQGPRQISTVDVRAEIENTLDLVDYYLRSRGIGVVQELAPDLPPTHADRQQLRQVFLNLFTNAADAMPTGGTLTIRARVQTVGGPAPSQEPEDRLNSPSRGPASLVIEVADTGGGIAPENLERIMEPFFTTKEEGKGTGLGLTICQRILQEHRGSLSIASEVGRGTVVRLTLPAANHVGDLP